MKRVVKFIKIISKRLLVQWFNRSKLGFGNRLLSHLIFDSEIGCYNYIGIGVIMNNVCVKNYCSIAAYTQIGGMEHDYSAFSTSTYLNAGRNARVIIEDDVWIGAGVYIRGGVHIGRGAIIGAGSVVLNDIPDFSISAGVPSKHLKYRFIEQLQKKHRDINFNLSPKSIERESFNS